MEIGSEFWNAETTNKENDFFAQNIRWYLSGRVALRALLQEIKKEKRVVSVAMPSWCCHTVIKPFIDEGINVHFYPIYWQDSLIQEISLESDVLFLMDYFGYSSKKPNLFGYNGLVIRDVTHSIFSSTYSDADFFFGSLRKWCGVWTGGYAWTKCDNSLPVGDTDDKGYAFIRDKAMQMKNLYINRCVNKDGNAINANKDFLQVFSEAEGILENLDGIVQAADRDVWLAKRLDISKIKARRRENAKVLMSAFPEWLIFSEMKDTDCPMFVPIIVPDGRRTDLRKYLISQGIYCPIHWPMSKYHQLNSKEKFIYENELSLVCDQRYTQKEMERIAETINTFFKI